MIKKIVYHSNSGFTEKYALLLGKKLNLEVHNINNEFSSSDEIIYMGNILASKIEKLEKANKMFNIKMIIAVGLQIESSDNNETIKKMNNIDKPFFYLRGGLNLEKLKGFKKFIMKMVIKSNSKEKTEQNVFENNADFFEEKKLDEIINWYNKNN